MSILNSIIKIFVGNKAKKDLKEISPIVLSINSLEENYSDLSNDELRNKTNEFKKEIKSLKKPFQDKIDVLNGNISNESDIEKKEKLYNDIEEIDQNFLEELDIYLNKILPDAFCIIRETAKRFSKNEEVIVTANENDIKLSSEKNYITLNKDKAKWSNSWDAAGKNIIWDMVHYDVQLFGGIVLHKGKIAEMQTGEGKTLVATLPVYLNALSGNGVHLVTVNDYLAKRDCAWMSPIFEFHGLSVDCIDNHRPNSIERRNAYLADITYGTNNEFGFDYLRDNMAHKLEDRVQRKHSYAIVDEVDSVLIDDARTPLIISGPVPKGNNHEFNDLKPKISSLVQIQKQLVTQILSDSKNLINEGDNENGGFKLLQAYRGLPKTKALIKFLSEGGVKQILLKTENYYMQDNNREMPKIDADLFFTIDEKNNQIELTDKGIEHLSKDLNDSNFFILPDISTKISEIENKNLKPEIEAEKKEKVYTEFSLKSERIHTLNQLLKAYTLFEKDIEYVVIDNKVKIVDEQTGRIMEGRRYSDGLHQAIEAKENVKIEDATQTFATITLQNYFRMYRKLSGMTGTAVTEQGEFWDIYKLDVVEIPTNKPVIRNDQNDLIYKTKREKYNAVIDNVNQIVKQGRPVLIGTTSVEISELLSRMLNIKNIKHNVLNAKLHKKEADIVAEAGKAGIVTIATNMAGRGTDIKISDEIKERGGLAIIGTERHDSRRVDRQLRGRSGRQGDPGSSQFYVSLEDNLMRLFGSDKVARMMDKMGHKDGEVIQHSLMTTTIERAQKKVEENNFGIRKRLLEYDDVMNLQREVIYTKRKNALDVNRLKVDIANMIYETVESIYISAKNNNEFKSFEFDLIRFFSITSPFNKDEFENLDQNRIIDDLYNVVLKHYEKKNYENSLKVFPVVKNVFENPQNKFERIVVPFTDGKKTMNIVTDLKKAYESEGKELINDFEKNISLAILDDTWKTHLRKMDELKQSVQLAVHEQKDPLLIYKFEAKELFFSMIDQLNKDILTFLFKGELPSKNPNEITEDRQTRRRERYNTSKEEILNSDEMANRNREVGARVSSGNSVVETIVREQRKIGRNERVKIKNIQTGEVKQVKYKQAEPLIQNGTWILNEN
ncbi:MAG: preprotein translocase subunit SecA [Flavobacteriaceae bacterium]|nr:preprotein translocase subunit SecA [Flavobacteriaceae bacterium]MBL6684090.1 preprotein translocase subunit SecA [Flavobacteriaceae bacterium]